jgi:LemA protein
VLEQGVDTRVIAKQLPVKVGVGSLIFEIILWVLGIIPGLVFLFMKINAAAYLRQLQQRINRNASEIENFMEQKSEILKNVQVLVQQAVKLDKETLTDIAKARSGLSDAQGDLNQMAEAVDRINTSINVAFEAYPELRAHSAIADAMQQNSYLQKEITAARTRYNDSVNQWNVDIQAWPTKMIVAAKAGYTTRVPFAISQAQREAARTAMKF